MTVYKSYLYKSRYSIPYDRLESFEARIEFPEASENLALTHLRQNTPKGFWNHGVLGELLARLNPQENDLPTSPLGKSHKKMILSHKISLGGSLHIVISFYEGLDKPDFFIQQLKSLSHLIRPEKVNIYFEYIPLTTNVPHSPGLEKLTYEATRIFNFEIKEISKLKGVMFQRQENFTHLHNKVFYYYSTYEVMARMNGANIIYSHPEKEMNLSFEDLQMFSFLKTAQRLELHHLQLIETLSEKLQFEFKP